MYEEYYEKIKQECLIRNLRPSTADVYFNQITVFLRWTGDKNPDDLTLSDVRNYISFLRLEKHFSTSYCNGINSALRFFYKFILRKKWDPDEVPRMVLDRELPKVLTLETIEKLIATATETRNKAIIALLYSSGLRVGELCRLAPNDIYMSTMQVHVRHGKNHCDRWTILSQTALDLLIQYWHEYPMKRDYLFVSLKSPYSQLNTSGVEIMLRKVSKAAGLETVNPHMLRHSFASHMVEHVLPKGFVRIRHYGLLSCRNKTEKMTLCRNLLGCEQYISRLRDKTTAEKILILYNRDIFKCRYCGEPVHTYKVSGRYMLC